MNDKTFVAGNTVKLFGMVEKHHNVSGFDIAIGSTGTVVEHGHSPLVRVQFQVRPNNNFKFTHPVLVWVKKENLELINP